MSTVPTPPSASGEPRREPDNPGTPLDSARVYPIPAAEDDPRFTCGLTLDVAAALGRHGYPVAAGSDFVALQQALFAFLYREGGDGR